MHWGGNAMGGFGVNTLTTGAFDPLSKQPELKHAVVQVETLPASAELVCMRRAEDGGGQDLLQSLRPFLRRLDGASLTLAGRDAAVVIFRARMPEPDAALLDELDEVLGLVAHASQVLAFSDQQTGVSKRARIDGSALTGLRLYGETRAADWLQGLLESGSDIAPLRRFLFAPLATPPVGQLQLGKVVCNCYNVSETAIREAFARGESRAALQQRTQCGTGCGSCLPEIRRLEASGGK
ncbi:MAG: hypothetical protein CVU28_01590 [Betaproteobacteria bacterium HGW-Betaproteobacteria-21]|nr:MAG: hypothetical protein CVU28_01590 [Betaproteobacteria bacterium HGW-Betaproteobacteria-21]